jgi:thiol-disulfide isomerase/thioredoxin
LIAALALVAVAAAPGPGQAPTRVLSPTDALERTWPGYPEWLASLAEVLSGHAPEPGQGWFRKGSSHTRLGWEYALGKYDRDADGAIAPAEYPGPPPEFSRLDRDRDGRLTRRDFDFAASPAGESRAIESFATADRDGDGQIKRTEFTSFAGTSGADPVYRMALAGPLGEMETRLFGRGREKVAFLSLADFQEAFDLGSKPGAVLSTPGPALKPEDRGKLLAAFLRRELGSFGQGPNLGAAAPDFTLPLATGRGELTLSSLIGSKPVVLIFGNLTCGPFRSHAGSLEQLAGRYKDRAQFVMVYTRESHSAEGWRPNNDQGAKFKVSQPGDFAGRSSLASRCGQTLRLEMPVAVDSMDDRVGRLYSGPPSRLYLIDKLGKIAYKGGRGPFGFKPAELEQSLILLLEGEPRPAELPDAPPALGELSPAASDPAQATGPGEPIDIRIDLDWRTACGAAAVVALIVAARFAWRGKAKPEGR